MEALIIISLVMLPIFIGIGFGIGKATKERIERKRIQILLDERDRTFRESFGKGRLWLAELIADARKALDEQLEMHLRHKKHPAHKSAEVVKEIAQL